MIFKQEYEECMELIKMNKRTAGEILKLYKIVEV